MKCDYCGKDYKAYDLKPVVMYRRTKYMCYKCREQGAMEVKKVTLQGLYKKGKLGDK